MASSGQVNDAYNSDAVTDPDDMVGESSAQLLKMETETLEEQNQQCAVISNEDTSKDTIEPNSSDHLAQESNSSVTSQDTNVQRPLPLTPLTPTLRQLGTPPNQPPLSPSAPPLHYSTSPNSPTPHYIPSPHLTGSPPPQSYVTSYPLVPSAPPPYQYVPPQGPLNYDVSMLPQDLPPSYDMAVIGSSSSSLFSPSQSQLDLQDMSNRPPQTYHKEMWLSCFVTIFCGVIFGFFAFLLAKEAEGAAARGREHEGRKFGKASLTMSISGILIGLMILVIVAVIFGVRTPNSSSSSSGLCRCRTYQYGTIGYNDCSSCYYDSLPTPTTPSQCYCSSYYGGPIYYRSCSACNARDTSGAPLCYCQTYLFDDYKFRKCSECYQPATTRVPQCYCSSYYGGPSYYRSCSECYAAFTTAAPLCYCQTYLFGDYNYRQCSECYPYQPATTRTPQCYCKAFWYGSEALRNCVDCYITTPAPQCFCRATSYEGYAFRPCSDCFESQTRTTTRQ